MADKVLTGVGAGDLNRRCKCGVFESSFAEDFVHDRADNDVHTNMAVRNLVDYISLAASYC